METIRYMSSLLTFYLKGEISQERNSIIFRKPNTILGLIPLGSKKESIPINQLSSVNSSFKLNFKNFIVGLIIAVLGIVLFSSVFIVGLILLIIGLNKLLTAFETYLIVELTSGSRKGVSFFIFEKNKADLAERNINELIGNRLDDTNTKQQTDRIVDAINKK